MVTGGGILPRRGLISRRPGTGSPAAVALGVAIVAVGLFFFFQDLDVPRNTFDFDVTMAHDRWNEAADERGFSLLGVGDFETRPDDSGDLVFGHEWTPDFGLRGRADAESGNVVELVVIGDPAVVDGGLIADAMELLVIVTEPGLDAAARRSTLQEIGVIGGDANADLRATRGGTDYVAAAGRDGSVGMSAAPHLGAKS